MTDIRQNTEDALAEIIEQSLGPDWTARDAARMIMDQLSDIGLQYADNVAISQPNEPGSFRGDIWFGHPEKRTLGTHRWDGHQWQMLPSELDSCLQMLAEALDEGKRLREAFLETREMLGLAEQVICEECCPTTWKTADGQPHSPLHEDIRAVLFKHEATRDEARAALGDSHDQ